jgi:HK97 family phage major capsid protein
MTAPVIPTTPEELAEAISDRKVVRDILNNEDKTLWPKFLTAYANANAKVDPGVERQVEEQVERALASFAKDNFAELRRPDMRPATVHDLRNSRQTGNAFMLDAPGKELNGKFATIMDFLEVVGGDPRDADVADKRKLIKNAMSTSDPSSGGFLVPEEYRTEMLQIALESAVVRPRARVVPMSTLRVAIPTVDATTNNGSVYGGIVGYWTEEGAAMVQSQPRFGRVALEAKKLTAYTEIPNELINDSNPSAEAFVRMTFPQAIAWFEDIAFLTGTGSPTLSLLGRPVIISEKVSSLTNQGDLSFVDFSQYLLGDRMSMQAELSTDYKFANDVTAFRFIERVDGRPWMQSAITPKNGGNTLSPYLQLGAR